MNDQIAAPEANTESGTVRGLLVNGDWIDGDGGRVPVLDKYRLRPGAYVTTASRAQVARAVDAAHDAFRRGALSPYERGAVLDRAAALVEARLPEFVRTMQMEAGFTVSDATGEVRRSVQTLKLSGEEARRLAGEVVPLAGAPQQAGRLGFTLRVPLGVVAAITPFNAPLNTVTHKVAPAFAAGNAAILKPASYTPLTACLLADALIEAGMPRGFLSVLLGGAQVAQWILEDERVRFFAFTGSTEVGREIQRAAGLRRTQMELGSIACTIVCDDARLATALPKIVGAAYRKAGQVCTSIQLLLVHESIVGDVQAQLAQQVAALPFGDPYDPATVVGPVISEDNAIRIEEWIDEAMARGAKRLAGGRRSRRGRAADAARRHRRLDERRLPRDLRPGDVHRAVRFARRGDRARQRHAVRARHRHLHQPARRRVRGGAAARGRRRAHQRDVELARRPHALRRLQGQRLRARGPALRRARDDGRAHRHDHRWLDACVRATSTAVVAATQRGSRARPPR